MLKGVTKRIVEINRPDNPAFERAVLYLKTDGVKKGTDPVAEAKEYLSGLSEPDDFVHGRKLRLTVAVLSLCLAVTAAALMILLVLYTKM